VCLVHEVRRGVKMTVLSGEAVNAGRAMANGWAAPSICSPRGQGKRLRAGMNEHGLIGGLRMRAREASRSLSPISAFPSPSAFTPLSDLLSTAQARVPADDMDIGAPPPARCQPISYRPRPRLRIPLPIPAPHLPSSLSLPPSSPCLSTSTRRRQDCGIGGRRGGCGRWKSQAGDAPRRESEDGRWGW
jgi:hypothetical protein